MKRRQAVLGIIGLGAGFASTRDAAAQRPAKVTVIGLLDAGERRDWWAAFRRRLGELGYAAGRNVSFEERYAAGRLNRLPEMAQELVRLKVAVIVSAGTAAAIAAKQASDSIPIVTATGTDHVSMGLANSLARPGGNLTGVTSLSSELTVKRFELLREIFPKLSRLAVLWHRDNQASTVVVRDLLGAAASSRVAIQNLGIRSAEDVPGAVHAAKQERADAIFVVHSPMFFHERKRIGDATSSERVPSMHGAAEYVEAGGLVSYGPHYPDLFVRAAEYVDRILKGARPADLPIEQPRKFEFVFNQRTASTIGVTIPTALLVRADRVIGPQ